MIVFLVVVGYLCWFIVLRIVDLENVCVDILVVMVVFFKWMVMLFIISLFVRMGVMMVCVLLDVGFIVGGGFLNFILWGIVRLLLLWLSVWLICGSLRLRCVVRVLRFVLLCGRLFLCLLLLSCLFFGSRYCFVFWVN